MTRRKIWLDRAVEFIPWLLGVLFGGVALHLVAILILPALAPDSAYRRFAKPLALGQKLLLPRAAPRYLGPTYADPFAALALCRFDLSQGSLHLRASADGDHPMSVSIRLADGTIIYSASDRQTPGGRFNISIMTQAQADAQDAEREKAEQDGAEEGGGAPAEDELRLISPGKSGFAVFRVLSLRESDYEAAASLLGLAECSVEKPAP